MVFMSKGFYSQFSNQELILRDHLAIDRTVLANERTFLAYICTALALVIAGASTPHFLKDWWWVVAGWFLVASGCLVLVIGTWRFKNVRHDLVREGARDKKMHGE